MTPKESTLNRVGRLFLLNPDSILGLIMFGVVLSMQDDDASSVSKAITSFVGVFALWIGHVFAHTVAGNGMTKDASVTMSSSLRKSLHQSWPMFGWTAPSILALVVAGMLGWPGGVATNVSLAVMSVTLFLIGGLIFATRGKGIPTRIFGGIATCAVGVIVVVIEILVRGLH